MMMIKEEEQGSRHSSWFKSFERNLIASLTKIQEFFLTWRNFFLSAEFWSMAWLWRSFWLKMCSLRISFSIGGGAKRSLMTWVSNQVPEDYLVKEFPACFKNGVLLCALIEKIIPGACPRYDLLDPDQSLRNLKLAIHLIEKHFKIKSPVTVREFLQDEGFPEKNLLLLIAQMKTASEKFKLQIPRTEPKKQLMSQTTFVSEKCFARGMGLLLAVRGRKACFTILLDSMDELDMVIEIRGPKNTACSKRLTSAYSLSRNESPEVCDIKSALITENISKQIPLEYTILGRKISIRYTPLESGVHSMNIIWQGQHIMGSPYTITVDSSIDAPDIWHKPTKRSHSPLRKLDIQDLNGSGERKKASSHPKSRGTITRKRIIRYIVKMEGNDVIVDGKEDLCEAINRIKKQHKKIPSNSGESFELNEDSEFLFKQEYEDVDRSTNSDDKINEEFSGTSNHISEFNEDQCTDVETADLLNLNDSFDLIKEKDSSDITKEINNEDSKTEVYGENYFDAFSAFETTDGKITSDCKNVNSHENKNICDIFKLQSFNTIAEVYTRSSSEESENFDDKRNGIDTERKNLINQGNKTNRRNKFPVFENKRVKNQSNGNTNSFSDNDMNSDINEDRSQLSASDDLFFPVHKVQYEMLHDDEEDTDDHTDYSTSKRRTSFTELHESNYLDEDVEEIDTTEVEDEDNFSSVPEVNETVDGYRVYENADKHYGAEDMRNCLRANHDLFQCDHSLSFWSETVTSTPPDFERNSLESNPEISGSNILNSPESAASGFDRMLLELGNIVSSETFSVGCEETNPLENSFFELKDSDFYTPISFSSDESDLNKHNDGDIELLKKYLMRELPDNKRRISWPDRDLLPSIQESSFEGIMDLESYNDKIKNKEIRENSDSSLNIIKSPTQNEDLCISEPSSPKRTDAKSESESGTLTGVLEEKSVENLPSAENTNESSSCSSNNVSNNCIKKEHQLKKLSEMKFTTCTYLERHLTHTSAAKMSNNYILTRATPVIIDDISENTPLCSTAVNSSDAHFNSLEYKQPQCLSVKRVVQIFQKEKEEPLDTWPSETQNSKSNLKTFKGDTLKIKSDDKADILDLGNGRFSRGDISRSSIRDRVKIFECDENKNSSATKQKSNDKFNGATINAKKNHW